MRAVSHNPPAAFFLLSELPGNERNYFSPALHCQPLPPSRLSSYRHPATSFPAAIFFPLTYRVLSFFFVLFFAFPSETRSLENGDLESRSGSRRKRSSFQFSTVLFSSTILLSSRSFRHFFRGLRNSFMSGANILSIKTEE